MGENVLLRYYNRLQYPPTQLYLGKSSIILQAKGKILRLYLELEHQTCFQHSTEPTKAFIEQGNHVIVLRKALAINFIVVYVDALTQKNHLTNYGISAQFSLQQQKHI